jgi:hypothetical protein
MGNLEIWSVVRYFLAKLNIFLKIKHIINTNPLHYLYLRLHFMASKNLRTQNVLHMTKAKGNSLYHCYTHAHCCIFKFKGASYNA